MSTEFRLLLSPLTRTVYAGRVRRMGKTDTVVSTGVRHDVTNDFYDCLVRLAESHGGAFEITGGADAWDVHVYKSDSPSCAKISALPDLIALATRVEKLNPDFAEIGAGMLASLVSDAQAVLKKAGAA